MSGIMEMEVLGLGSLHNGIDDGLNILAQITIDGKQVI
jgi:hypothetical protein